MATLLASKSNVSVSARVSGTERAISLVALRNSRSVSRFLVRMGSSLEASLKSPRWRVPDSHSSSSSGVSARFKVMLVLLASNSSRMASLDAA